MATIRSFTHTHNLLFLATRSLFSHFLRAADHRDQVDCLPFRYACTFACLQARLFTLACRWMAPESLRSGLFSGASDGTGGAGPSIVVFTECMHAVWGIGVTAWELYANGLLPWTRLTNDDVLREGWSLLFLGVACKAYACKQAINSCTLGW